MGALQKKESGIPAKEPGGQTRGGPIIFCDFDKTPPSLHPTRKEEEERTKKSASPPPLFVLPSLSLFACVSQREIGREIRNWK